MKSPSNNDQLTFVDDFSDPSVERFYEYRPGVGEIERRETGLHYKISRTPDGPPSSLDHLTIDSLGRPQPPSAQARLSFEGKRWTVELEVEYDFETKMNGRAGNIWVVFGEPTARYERSILFSRSADLQPESHSLSVSLQEGREEPQSRQLSKHPNRWNWFRVERFEAKMAARWSEDGERFETVWEWTDDAAPALQSILINSSSFAGGAAFVVRTLRITGAHPIGRSARPSPFVVQGTRSSPAEVRAEEIGDALSAGRNVALAGCVVLGTLDLAKIVQPIGSDVSFRDCDFRDSLYASNTTIVTGRFSAFGSRFAGVGFSNVLFHESFEAIGCHFTGDTRFIETELAQGADFSLSVFERKPFFRIAQLYKALSLYHCDFFAGGDFSALRIAGDLSISDIHLRAGTLTFRQSAVTGATRLMVTLQRDAQPFGGAVDLSNTQLGSLIVSAGDRNNRGEYTGPPQWDLDAEVFLREARIGAFLMHNVRFTKPLDLSGCSVATIDKNTAHFFQVIGGWPVSTEFYSCFISYSSRDQSFADALEAQLSENGVRCWFAPKDLRMGDRFRQKIDDAILEYDKLLLVLSEESVKSDWVREEVEACFERENREKTTVLCPIRLDDAVLNTTEAWAASIRRQRHIGDFRGWRDRAEYLGGFERLLLDLKVQRNSNV